MKGYRSRISTYFTKFRGLLGRKDFQDELVDTVAQLALIGTTLGLIAHNISYMTFLSGPSMLPTVKAKGDIALVDVWRLGFSGVQRGDVVIVRKPEAPINERVCKRVTAVAGDTVVYYKRYSQQPIFVTVPPGHVWLSGDNPAQSNDSRNYGPVPSNLVLGRVACIIGPGRSSIFTTFPFNYVPWLIFPRHGLPDRVHVSHTGLLVHHSRVTEWSRQDIIGEPFYPGLLSSLGLAFLEKLWVGHGRDPFDMKSYMDGYRLVSSVLALQMRRQALQDSKMVLDDIEHAEQALLCHDGEDELHADMNKLRVRSAKAPKEDVTSNKATTTAAATAQARGQGKQPLAHLSEAARTRAEVLMRDRRDLLLEDESFDMAVSGCSHKRFRSTGGLRDMYFALFRSRGEMEYHSDVHNAVRRSRR